MWPISRKRQAGRLRKNGATAPPRPLERLRAKGGASAVLLVLGFYTAVLALDLWPFQPLPHRVGQYVPDDIYARVSFTVLSDDQIIEEREQAARNTPAVIRLDTKTLDRILSELRNLPGELKSATQPAQVSEEIRRRFDLKDRRELEAFGAYSDPQRMADYNAYLDKLRDNLLSRYVVTTNDYLAAGVQKQTQDVQVVGGKAEGRLQTAKDGGLEASLQPKSRLLSLDSTRQLEDFLKKAVTVLPASIQDNVRYYLEQTLGRNEPLYRLDPEATKAAEQAARNAVQPRSKTISDHTLLVSRTPHRGWQTDGLKDTDLARLQAEHQTYVRQQRDEHPWRTLGILAGRVGVVGFVVLFLAIYVGRYHGPSRESLYRGLGVAAVLLIMLVLDKVVIDLGRLNPMLAVFSAFMAAAIFCIAYEQQFAFAVAGALAVLSALQFRLGVGELLVLWTAVGATVYQLREIRTRSKLIAAGGVSAAAVVAAVWAVDLAAGVPVRFVIVDAGYAAAALVAGGFVAQGLLPLIERVFHVATSLTLLEWCDANKPLLKRLALEAPGTYNHCLLLGTMCEAAADAIAARGLLARVGAYYHDIGKINKPHYFVENQLGPGSRHARLSPAMSLLIIKGHVKDGLELAKEYGLPRVLREFISSHHGTTLVEYFYHAAAQQRRADVDRAPDEVEFRYPGPKPRLKEAAILMMADAAESAVRAMSEPSPGRIENQVHSVIYKRLMDGQLDDCDITLKEVHGVEASLVASLVGMYHGRVKYPAQERSDRERAERLEQPEKPADPAAVKTETVTEAGESAPSPADDGQDKPAAQPAATADSGNNGQGPAPAEPALPPAQRK